jgi:hypothetical protein
VILVVLAGDGPRRADDDRYDGQPLQPVFHVKLLAPRDYTYASHDKIARR